MENFIERTDFISHVIWAACEETKPEMDEKI